MSVTLIVAMDEGGLIGRDGDLPWRLPEDLKHFRRHTLGHIVLMGRTTFQSLPRLLDGRDNWILSRDPAFRPPGATVFADVEAALEQARRQAREVMVIGGAQVYAALLPLAERILLTRVHTRLSGDTRFPDHEFAGWCAVSLDVRSADERHAYPYSFLELTRR